MKQENYETAIQLSDAIKERDRLKADLDKAQAENARLVATLVNIAEYWNGSHSDEAMRDACERIPMLANASLCENAAIEGKI